MAKNIIFQVLFYTPEALAAVSAGADWKDYSTKKDIYYAPCMLDVERVESACPSYRFKKHTTVVMYSGEEYILNILPQDYYQIVDHVVASKVLCRLKN